jgi:hypothetical protein
MLDWVLGSVPPNHRLIGSRERKAAMKLAEPEHVATNFYQTVNTGLPAEQAKRSEAGAQPILGGSLTRPRFLTKAELPNKLDMQTLGLSRLTTTSTDGTELSASASVGPFFVSDHPYKRLVASTTVGGAAASTHTEGTSNVTSSIGVIRQQYHGATMLYEFDFTPTMSGHRVPLSNPMVQPGR